MNLFFPIEKLSKWLTYDVFGIAKQSYLGDSIEFFIFDIVKIFILLCVLIFFVSFIRFYLPLEKLKRSLERRNFFLGAVIASLIGVITPFCSCSAIPLFLSFVEVEIPVGIAFAFLVASPMINEVALIMLFGLFGLKIALIYALSGVVLSVCAGFILQKMHAEKWLKEDFFLGSLSKENSDASCCTAAKLLSARVKKSARYTFSIIRKIAPYVIVGVGIGAWIHGYVPDNFLAKYADASKWYDVPLATLLGVPLYSNAAGVIPLVSSLTEKGLSMGTALAFMMAITALSFPEFCILKRVMKTRLILVYFAIIAFGIMVVGYLFNLILS